MRTPVSVACVLLTWAWVPAADAQDSPDPAPNEDQALVEMSRLGEELKKLGDWEQQAEVITETVDDIWARNGWNSEADQFARGVVSEIAEIPPWQIDQRIDKIVERFGDRYELRGPGRARFKGSLYREMLGGIWNHAGVVFKQTREMVGAMIRDEPFTQQQVAEWTRQSEPLMEEMRQRSATIVEQFRGSIDESYLEQFDRDLESYGRRMAYMTRQREAWAKGQWKPQDWGLQNQPAYRGWRPDEPAADTPANPRERIARLLEGRAVPHDPSTWHWHAGGAIERYSLDPGQAAAARSILAELTERAADYIRPRAHRLDNVEPADRSTDPAYAPVRAMYDELRIRLARIPTASQRAVATTQPSIPQ